MEEIRWVMLLNLHSYREHHMNTLRPPITRSDHIRGSIDAAVTLVEYGDYQCPNCGEAHPQVKLLEHHFGNRLCFAFRHFPLSQIHPYAEPAAESVEVAAAHGRFWEMHDGLYENQELLGPPLFFTLARELGISDSELNQALTTHIYAPKVRRDFLSGVRSGVNGTPTFFINGRRHDGTYLFQDLANVIETHLHATRIVID
jgi:protein-disulfide isomerase